MSLNQALLIIDVQQDLVDGNGEEKEIFQKEELLNTINLTIEKAIQFNIPVIFVRDKDVANGVGPGFQIHNHLTIPGDAIFFDKYATNAFHDTGLLEHLQTEDIKHLVIMGCKTEHCIDTAVRTTTINQLDVTLVKNGHSTCDTEVLNAEQIINHHNATLHGHYNVEHFSLVRNSEEDLFNPTHNQYR